MNRLRTPKLDRVVDDFLEGLSADRKDHLVHLLLNAQIKESWPWFKEVIDLYNLSDVDNGLISEIDEAFADESAFKLIESDSDLPIFEAKIILREAQKRLLNDGSSR
jgi:hypothetical protein